MRKTLLASLCFMLCSACKHDNNTFTVTGTIKKMGNGEIYFIKAWDEKQIDTVKVVNDKFTYSGKLTEPLIYVISFGKEQQPGFAIVEAGNTEVSYEMGNVKSLDIKGGKEQDLYNNFFNQCKPAFTTMDSISAVATENGENEELMAKLQAQFMQIDSSLKIKQVDFIKKNGSSIATAFIAINYLNEKQTKTLEEIEAIYNGFDAKIKQTYYGKKIAGMMAVIKNTTIGHSAPEFTLPDISNQPVTLSSFKGKITLIDFWASWCGPCREENSNIVKAYKKFHAKGFDIVGVSLDKDKTQWETAIQRDGLTWIQVSDLKGWRSIIAEQYGIQSIPTNYLLDKEGRILAKGLRGEELENKLSELLK